MFYVANITGSLVPFDPRTMVLSEVRKLPVVSAVPPVLAAIPIPIERIADLSESQLAEPLAESAGEAATFDGAVVFASEISTPAIASTSNISRASAMMAYVGHESAADSPTQSEDIAAIIATPNSNAVDDDAARSKQKVNPIKKSNYKGFNAPPERKPALVAADIMSAPVLSLPVGSWASEAGKIFKTKRFRHIPVISSQKKVIGILSDRDVLGKDILATQTVESIMVTNVLAVKSTALIPEIAAVMIAHHVGCLPVLDELGVLVGMLTRTDILRAIVNHAPIELWT